MNKLNKRQDEEYMNIPLTLLVSEANIRSEYPEEEIDQLAESMKKYGQLQPIRVFERRGDYIIIFGHRRFMAAKKAGLVALNSIIVPEPSSIDRIYLQVIENEQAQPLSPEDREAYIKLLLDKGESYKSIAEKISKSESWVRTCSVAFNTRNKFQDLINNTGMNFGTKDMYALRNAAEEDIQEIINELVEDPSAKNDALKGINKRTKKKMNSGKKPKESKETDDLLGYFQIILAIKCDENDKTIIIKKVDTSDLTEGESDFLISALYYIYEERGYRQLHEDSN